MGVLLKNIINELEEIAPLWLAESYDNVGLLVGDENADIKRIMCVLDITYDILEKAKESNVDLIISHHPLIFKGLKRILKSDDMGKIIIFAIKNNINIYSAHTNLDFCDKSISGYLLNKLGINNIRNLIDYKSEELFKLAVFVPKDDLNKVRIAMTENGAGWIGNYSSCTFTSSGLGSFLPLEGTKPHIGEQNKLEIVEEVKLESIVKKNDIKRVINEIIKVHPYEEVAYDLYRLENKAKVYGYGMMGTLDKSVNLKDFIKDLKIKLNIKNLRLIAGKNCMIKNIGVFNGSYDKNILAQVNKKVDLLITGDIKYHDAMDIKSSGLNVIDCGHFETEIIVKQLFQDILRDRIKDIKFVENDTEKSPFDFV